MGRWIFLLALGGAGALLIRGFLLEGIVVASGSMEPTLYVGRHIFVNKMAYRFSPPRRGDIVVFASPVENKDLVKRVIAVAGDHVRVERKRVVLNGRLLEEPYVKHTRSGEMLQGDNLDVGVIPPGQVFVLGDNRDQSGDSRDWKDARTGEHIFFIPVERIKGKLMGE
ncbi:MAG: signal peptidase I [Elusimicrobiota bacterium]